MALITLLIVCVIKGKTGSMEMTARTIRRSLVICSRIVVTMVRGLTMTHLASIGRCSMGTVIAKVGAGIMKNDTGIAVTCITPDLTSWCLD